MELPGTRRDLLKKVSLLSAFGIPSQVRAVPGEHLGPDAIRWIEDATSSKSLAAPLRLSRFVEPIYYLLEPGIIWTPNPDNGTKFSKVKVPTGFITDLASIPPAFFSILRPDDEYAQAAIVHDYLYWTQRTTRDYADEVFKIAMRDLEVNPLQIRSISLAVQAFGQSAWDNNRKLKRAGERRFLKNYPTEARTRYSAWRSESTNFYPGDL